MLEFNSYVEDTHRRIFNAPDFGEPGGSATLQHPDGTTEVIKGVVGVTEDVRVWPGGIEARGLGVDVGVLDQVGDYVLTIAQTDGNGSPQVTTYLIHSQHDRERHVPAQEV